MNLDGNARLLREKGLGKKSNKTNSLTRQEKDKPWECGQLGDKTRKSIIATLWWQLTQHFGLWERQQHYSMRVEDFSFQKDETGATYIVYAEGIAKTRQSGLHQKRRLQLPKMFETQSERCPVKLFQKYLSKRPVEMEKSGPFYLQTIVNPLINIWYKKTPMGLAVSIHWWKIWHQIQLFRIVKNTWQTIQTTASPQIWNNQHHWT